MPGSLGRRRNLNVSLPGPLYVRVRRAAAAEDKSVSGYVVDLLKGRVGGDDEGEQQSPMALLLADARRARAKQKPGPPTPRPTKDDLHSDEP